MSSRSDVQHSSQEHDPLFEALLPTEKQSRSRNTIWQEAIGLWTLAAPLALQNLFNYLLGVFIIMFTGRLGEFELGALVLASALFNVTGYAILFGFSSSIEYLGGAAFGANNYSQCGIILQQAVMINTVVFGLICGLWTQFGPLLRLFGQHEDMIAATLHVLWLMTPAMWSTGMVECLKRYLMVQGEVTPALVATIITTLIAPVYNYLLIFKTGWGLTGAALAYDAAFLTNMLLLLLYIIYRDVQLIGKPQQSFKGLSAQAFNGWGRFCQLGVNATLMLIAEWWSFAIAVLMAGTLPHPDASVAVMGIGNSLEELLYMLPLGLGGAAATRIANELGGSCPEGGKRAGDVAVVLTLAIQVIVAVAMYFGRYAVGYAFSDVPVVVEGCASMMLPLAVVILLDGLSATMGGVLRGTGKQKLGAIINVPAHWVIGLPMAYYFGFVRGWGVPGLWVGIGCAVLMQCVGQGIALLSFDWVILAQEAAERVSHMTDSDAIVEEGSMVLVTKSRASLTSLNPTMEARKLLQRSRSSRTDEQTHAGLRAEP